MSARGRQHSAVRRHLTRRARAELVAVQVSVQVLDAGPHSAVRRILSEETKALISAALTGKPHPHVGHPQSADTRAKISAALYAHYGTSPGAPKKKHRHHPLKKKHHQKHKHHKKQLKHLGHPGARRVTTHPLKRITQPSRTARGHKPSTARRQHPRSRTVAAQHRFHARVTGPVQHRFHNRNRSLHSKGRHAHLISAHRHRRLMGFVHTRRLTRGLARGKHGTGVTKIRAPHLSTRAHRVWLHKPGGRSHHRL